MKIAVIGSTGLVGNKMLQVLDEQHIAFDKLILAATEKSVGKQQIVGQKAYQLVSVGEALALKPDIALFSAGAAASLEWAPRFAEVGTRVIDNSSAWRKDENVPLVVPEVNAAAITAKSYIIANPNCSTIQLVAAINPLHRAFKIKRLIVSSYQSVSGSGVKGIDQLNLEQNGMPVEKPAYPHPIHRNIIPHGGDFDESGYTSEEQKLLFETRKIMSAPEIAITATVVRVPVTGGHSESVNIEFENNFSLEAVYEILRNAPGLVVLDDPSSNLYPMPIMAENRDEVFVGRIRRDFSISNGLNMWIVADNLRKGAATNAVQIAQYLIERNFI